MTLTTCMHVKEVMWVTRKVHVTCMFHVQHFKLGNYSKIITLTDTQVPPFINLCVYSLQCNPLYISVRVKLPTRSRYSLQLNGKISQGENKWNFQFQCNKSGIYPEFHCYSQLIPWLYITKYSVVLLWDSQWPSSLIVIPKFHNCTHTHCMHYSFVTIALLCTQFVAMY